MTNLTRRLYCLVWGLASLAFFVAACTPPPSDSAEGAQSPTPSSTGHSALPAAPTRTPTPAGPTLDPAPTSGRATRLTPTASATVDPCSKEARPGSAMPSGEIITATLQTDLLRKPLVYRVYLPPCYAERPAARYPSLYMFHGQSYNDDQWDRLGIDETADRLISAGRIPALVIVMPFDQYGGQPTETGFSQAVVELLIPTIDADYRAMPERKYRAAGGLSRGAGWAIHFGIEHWRLFGRIGAHSTAVFHTDAQRMRTWLGAIPPDQYPQVYMDIGDRDRPEIIRSTEWFEDLLNRYDLPHEYHLFSGYHSEEYWGAHLEDYLLWYTKDW